MDVVMVTNNALEDKTGGHERYVRELASTLAQNGHTVTIIAKRWSKQQPAIERRPDGVVIERYAVPSKRNPLFALLYPAYVFVGVDKRLQRRGASVIHAHMGLPALALAVRGIPFVFTFHAPVWRELLSERQGTYALPPSLQQAFVRVLRSVESLVARRAKATVVLSDFMRNELALLDQTAAERAHVIPGGIDITRFSCAEPPDAHPPDAPAVLFTARRLTPRTGVDELIRAMPLIAREIPRVRLYIAGTGQQAEQLKELAVMSGAESSVEFLGRVSDEELVAWYRRATLVVLPTRELEGFGLTTAEAMSCGAAVVGTSAGATPELLNRLDPGLLSDDITADAISQTVVSMLLDPNRLASARARARSVIVPEMGWDEVADQYLNVYGRFLERR